MTDKHANVLLKYRQTKNLTSDLAVMPTVCAAYERLPAWVCIQIPVLVNNLCEDYQCGCCDISFSCRQESLSVIHITHHW